MLAVITLSKATALYISHSTGCIGLNYGYIQRNLTELTEEISELSKKYSKNGVTLVAVTKSAEDDEVIALCRAGAQDIGENRPQMLAAREEILREAGITPTLHAIGTIQRNKARIVVSRAALVHSLDSMKLAEALNREAATLGIRLPVLIEINSAREAAKGGILPEDAETFLNAALGLSHLAISGIMTMGPVCECAEDIRPYFRETKKLYDDFNSRYGFAGGGILSMGMSDSYRIAIEEGSTLVRVGRRLFIK